MAVPTQRSRFFNRALRVTIIGQIPTLWLLYRTLEVLQAPWPALFTVLLAGWLNSGLLVYVRHTMPERPIAPMARALLVLPFFIWFFVCTLAMVPALLIALGQILAWGQPEAVHAAWQGWLEGAVLGVMGLALAVAFYACFIRRRWVRTVTLEIPIQGLPESLDGFRIVQLSDLHIGNFSTQAWLERWVARANGLSPDLVVVTGDLINAGDHFVVPMAKGLSGLRAREGVVVSLGNHDYWSDVPALVSALRSSGLEVMRNTGREIRRGEGRLYLAAVDDTWTGRADLEAALGGRPNGMPAVLLAHDPTLFPAAAERGVGLTLSGHTHGGQLAVPFRPRWNLSARVYPYTAGLYQVGASSLFVHQGLGTTGPPIRLGAAPEIAVLVLRRGKE